MESPASPLENAAEFAWQHDDVFGRIASRYDLPCDVFSLGVHRLWKRRVARRIAAEPWQTLLDSATGTALAAEIAAHGFQNVRFERLSLGIVAIHTARKPREDDRPSPGRRRVVDQEGDST
jgi:ubiquinone/menaquinone biosynthesis C-methylase UbiE